ncbi:hypothetical protein EMGBS15_06500 [Filimonas sp.]|nr:hypothetical protein EMGBS15_06500 [Filimonas sp.]
MSKISEVGHAKNAANFNHLIDAVIGLGNSYKPTKVSLKLPALNALADTAVSDLGKVVEQNIAFNNAVNARSIAFSNLSSLSTRILASLRATDATPEMIEDAEGFQRKIQGRRAKPKPVADPETPPPASHSVSQMSYDLLAQHFKGLMTLAASEASYNPEEDDLNAAGLTAKLDELVTKNEKVSAAFIGVSNARIKRDTTLYGPAVGLVYTASAVKEYVKSLLGTQNPQYKLIRKISFKKDLK